MRTFELERFIEPLDLCRKEDLFPVAELFSFSVSKQLRKTELKALVVDKLLEMDIFSEAEVNSYFNAFERLAIALKWPEEMWPLLLQCKIISKAQEVVSALPLANSLNYDVVKEAIFRAYELVPEVHRQSFVVIGSPPARRLSNLPGTRELYSIVGAPPPKLQILQSLENYF